MKNGSQYFRKTAESVPFGWIRRVAGTEKCADRGFWKGEREGVGWRGVGIGLIFGALGILGILSRYIRILTFFTMEFNANT